MDVWKCLYVYVCMYVGVCIYVCVWIFGSMFVCMYESMYVYTYALWIKGNMMSESKYLCRHLKKRVCIMNVESLYVVMPIYMHVWMNGSMYVFEYVCMNVR